MGSDQHYAEERPAHRVSVDGFWIDRYPVTNERFARFVEATGHITFAEIPPDPAHYPGALSHMLYAGMLLGRLAPDMARKVANPLMLAAAIVLVAGALPILLTGWPAIASLIGNGTLVAFVTFALIALAAGHLLGGPDPDDQTVLALSTSSRHPAIALAIAHASLPGDKTVLGAVLLYLLVSAMSSIPYVNWRKRITADVAGAARPGTSPRLS